MVLALQRATHHTLHALSAALADLNLSAAEINALANLGEGGTLSVRQLSERTGTRASTLTGLLDRLENRGYLVREVDPADRRSFRLPLTDQGREVAARALAAIADLERDGAIPAGRRPSWPDTTPSSPPCRRPADAAPQPGRP